MDLLAFDPQSPYKMPISIAHKTCNNNFRWVIVYIVIRTEITDMISFNVSTNLANFCLYTEFIFRELNLPSHDNNKLGIVQRVSKISTIPMAI